MSVGQMHPVDQQPIVGAQLGQPLGGRGVHRALGHVDVYPGAQIGGQAGGGCQRAVGAGEGGVDPDHAPAPGPQKLLVLGQAPPGPVGAVAVGHPVGAADPHPHLGASIGNGLQRALDGVGRLVVVDDGGAARLQRLQRAQLGRPLDDVEVERPVEAPPDQLQDVGEAGGRAGRGGHPPGQCGIQVMVGADQPGRGAGQGVPHSPMGRLLCHVPLWARSAAATAPAVGTKPISPTPLMP